MDEREMRYMRLIGRRKMGYMRLMGKWATLDQWGEGNGLHEINEEDGNGLHEINGERDMGYMRSSGEREWEWAARLGQFCRQTISNGST